MIINTIKYPSIYNQKDNTIIPLIKYWKKIQSMIATYIANSQPVNKVKMFHISQVR